MGHLIRDRCKEIETAKQHEIQPQLKARASFGVLLPDQQTVEADQRIVTLVPDPGTLQHNACMSAKMAATGTLILVRTSSVLSLRRSKPRSTRTAPKQVHQTTPERLPITYRIDGLSAILQLCRGLIQGLCKCQYVSLPSLQG